MGIKDTKVAYQDVLKCYEKLENHNKILDTINGSEHGFHEEPYETLVVEKIVNFFGSNWEKG